jgi:predicted DNA binding protein/PAS domain-containing protein
VTGDNRGTEPNEPDADADGDRDRGRDAPTERRGEDVPGGEDGRVSSGDGESGRAGAADGLTTSLLDGAREGILRVAADGTVVEANRVAADLLAVSPGDLVGAPVAEVVPAAVEGQLAAGLADGGPTDQVEFEEYYPEREQWLSVRLTPLPTGAGTAVYLQEVTARRERERTLSTREAEFATLDRVNRLIGELVASLVDRTDRDRIETTVCERLAGSDLFEFAWLGEPTLDGYGLRERVTAGPGASVVAPLLAVEDTEPRRSTTAERAADHPSGADGVNRRERAGDGAEADPRTDGPSDRAAADERQHSDREGDHRHEGDREREPEREGERERDGEGVGDGLERAALVADEVRVARGLPTDRRVPAAARRVAFERGLQSALAVPVGYGDTTYGVLGVYTTRPEAFADRERAAFDTLGEVLGLAINAAKQRRLLLSDTTVELDLEFGADDSPLAALSARLGCRLEATGTVPVEGGSLIQFLTVSGAEAAGVLNALRADEELSLTAGRIVEAADGTASDLLSLRLSGSSPLVWLVDHGATIEGLTVENGRTTLSATVAPDEARQLLDGLTEAFPGVTLTGKHETERDVRTAGSFRSSVRSRLTDRQHEVLRTGYLAGYFDWPRRSTAEEVADTMDISSATLHGHVRKSLRELLDVFFTDDDDRPRGR